jgi:hypothetical protein
MRINDESFAPDELDVKRERDLAAAFARAGVEVEFVN